MITAAKIAFDERRRQRSNGSARCIEAADRSGRLELDNTAARSCARPGQRNDIGALARSQSAAIAPKQNIDVLCALGSTIGWR
jgi:hypothetical protein